MVMGREFMVQRPRTVNLPFYGGSVSEAAGRGIFGKTILCAWPSIILDYFCVVSNPVWTSKHTNTIQEHLSGKK